MHGEREGEKRKNHKQMFWCSVSPRQTRIQIMFMELTEKALPLCWGQLQWDNTALTWAVPPWCKHKPLCKSLNELENN